MFLLILKCRTNTTHPSQATSPLLEVNQHVCFLLVLFLFSIYILLCQIIILFYLTRLNFLFVCKDGTFDFDMNESNVSLLTLLQSVREHIKGMYQYILI